jgi:hypothetical protein
MGNALFSNLVERGRELLSTILPSGTIEEVNSYPVAAIQVITIWRIKTTEHDSLIVLGARSSTTVSMG